jgi:hypothetical protein
MGTAAVALFAVGFSIFVASVSTAHAAFRPR